MINMTFHLMIIIICTFFQNLHRQVETLTTELQQEKEDKFNLSLKFNDLEKSYQEEQSDKDKVFYLSCCKSFAVTFS